MLLIKWNFYLLHPSAKVKLMIVSGTNEIQAKTRFNILSNAFCEIGREDILVGFAYEYGAFKFVDCHAPI